MLSAYVDTLVLRPPVIKNGMPYGYSLLPVGIKKLRGSDDLGLLKKGPVTIGLKGRFRSYCRGITPCDGVGDIVVVDTVGAVVRLGDETIAFQSTMRPVVPLHFKDCC